MCKIPFLSKILPLKTAMWIVATPEKKSIRMSRVSLLVDEIAALLIIPILQVAVIVSGREGVQEVLQCNPLAVRHGFDVPQCSI